MSYPDKPAAAYDYVTFQSGSPTDPLPADQVAADFAELNDSVDQVIDFIKIGLRSDGNLNNGIVRPESLSAATLALMGTEVTFRGAWVTATAYVVNNVVTESNKTYICIVAHTSGTFATDLAAAKWQLLEGDNASLAGNNVFGGTNEFDGTVNFDGAEDHSGTETHSGAVTFSGTVAVPTVSAGDSDTSAASTAFVQAAVGKVYIQKFTSVPTTVTVTAATPAVMTWTAHGLAIGQAFQAATSGTLPAGMALTTTYFIISAGFGANSFQFSLTRGGAAINTTDTGSGTHTATPFWVPNTGMVKSIGETWGGGGGGGGIAAPGTGGQTGSAGGGGAGSYSRKLIAAADVAAAGVAVTVGAAGSAGSAGNNAGGAGGDTSIGALCIGKGGSGGAGSAGTSGAVALGGLGGVAGTGDVTTTGAPGETGATFTHYMPTSGGSSSVGGGGLGNATTTTSVAGNAGTGRASGGGGGFGVNSSTTAAGGAGTAGYVVITEFCNQ